MEPTQTTEQTARPASSTGPVIVLVLIVALIVAGAFYTWQNRMSAPTNEQAIVESFETQDDSTEPSSIEADLEAQSSDEFDAELDKAFTELDASFEE